MTPTRAALLGGTSLVLALAAPRPACASAERVSAARSGAAPTRSLWLAPTYQLLLGSAFEPSSRHGVGAGASYEFHVSPSFNIGLSLAYRLYPGSQSTQQLGYGTILKHFFSERWVSDDGLYPYLDYGLLLQQSFVEGRRSSAISHDTRLGAGALLRSSGAAFFVGLAAHYSRLHHFDVESRAIPYLDVQLGWVHAF